MGLVVVPDDRVFYVFGSDNEPVATARPGDRVVVYTRDAFGGQIKGEDQFVTSINPSRINPATGPIYVEGAEPGDALVVRVLSISTAEKGFVVTAPGMGALPQLTREARTRPCRVRGEFVEFLGLKIPARKMIGVIGVATSENLPTRFPGRHGGNIDTRFVTVGSTVILPVEYSGGLLGVGDVHAAMGDGEVCVSACEVPGKVVLELDILEKAAPAWPVIIYGDSSYILVSFDNLEKAVQEAIEAAVEVLARALRVDWYDAYMLASLAVDVGISQLVDPRITVWTRIPKSIIPPEKLVGALFTKREQP